VIFEYDPAKSASNKEKHGIDFEQAAKLWDAKTVSVTLRVADEPRTLVIGRIGEKHWTAIVTQRGEKLRIISVRRARKKEEQVYEKAE
jgi:hypothetical protein